MTQDISSFNVAEAERVYKEALEKAEITYFNGDRVTLTNVKVVATSIRSICAVPHRDSNSEYDGELDDLAESINEVLAQEIYISQDADHAEISFWPVIFPASSKGQQYLYSSGHPRGNSSRWGDPSGCQLSSDNKGYEANNIGLSFFLASDSEHYFESEGGNHRIWTQHFNSSLRDLWVGIPVEKGRATGSLGAGRCDSVDEVDYRWMGNYELGIALGLLENEYIKTPQAEDKTSLTSQIQKGKETHIYRDCYSRGKYLYEYCFYKDNKDNEKTFYLTNFPGGSEILYFKHFNQEAQKKNLPDVPTTDFLPPRNFKPVSNRLFEFNERKKIKPVTPLGIAKGARAAANGEMLKTLKPLMPELKPSIAGQVDENEIGRTTALRYFVNGPSSEEQGKPGKGSARAFAGYILNEAEPDIDQEWCHLLGHGDGGSEEPSNFVSGSKHCNSEQLAIEEGQRLWSQRTSPPKLLAKITTYIQPLAIADTTVAGKVFNKLLELLEPNASMEIDSNIDFKEMDETKIAKAIKQANLLTKKTGNKGEKVLIFADNFKDTYVSFTNKYKQQKDELSDYWKAVVYNLERAYVCNFYPKFMRYKIIKIDPNTKYPTKVFDHVYNAQSESFNYHEFKILKTTVDRLIAEALDQATAYEERIKKKAPSYELSNILFYRDDNGGVKVGKDENTDAMDLVTDGDTDGDTDVEMDVGNG